ncbi:hypothetical protein FF36_01889 [Frankia torreyi]|uniref:Uncharacterized protein n=1 Tax=Frankia torreyi TaxID=1856 RepID=A0A0D8BI88_9ACTN|nr:MULTISPECIES: hypothetical protein [Frankia]KJE23704.1 hypothetical protein FF36_01889 [Frankia torreyi]KQM05684.1 hypothetical protein FF86_1014102 [Frankia sp. CpI1-P]
MTSIDSGLAALLPAAGVCHVRATATQTLTPGRDSPVVFGAAAVDDEGMWDPAQPTRITVRTAGAYAVYGIVTFAAGEADRRATYRRNGTDVMSASTGPAADGAELELAVTIVRLAAGDYLELTATGPLATTLAQDGCQLAVARLDRR